MLLFSITTTLDQSLHHYKQNKNDEEDQVANCVVLFFYVWVEKLSHWNPRVLRLNVVLLIVACEPCPKLVVFFEPCVVNILKIDCSFVEDVSGLRKTLIHVGHIIVLVFFNHVPNLFVTYEHWCSFRRSSILNPEALRNCYYSKRFLQLLISVYVYIRESYSSLVFISKNFTCCVQSFTVPKILPCFPCFHKWNEPRFVWVEDFWVVKVPCQSHNSFFNRPVWIIAFPASESLILD